MFFSLALYPVFDFAQNSDGMQRRRGRMSLHSRSCAPKLHPRRGQSVPGPVVQSGGISGIGNFILLNSATWRFLKNLGDEVKRFIRRSAIRCADTV
jgi:hypothetical protein